MSETYSMEDFKEHIEQMRHVVTHLKGGKTVAQLMSEPQKTVEVSQVQNQGRNK